jgi:hypothetical protein
MSDLLANEGSWTQGAYARNEHGKKVWYLDAGAVCWCLSGALGKCYPDDDPRKLDAVARLRKALDDAAGFQVTASQWNDAWGRSRQEVLALCLKAGV